MIRVCITITQIMTLKKMRNKKIIEASLDKNSLWILLLPIICMVAMKIPAILIY